MPMGRPCLRRRCPNFALPRSSYCVEHSRKTEEPWRKLYTTKPWDRAREATLNEAGHACRRCGSRKRPQVHHRVKLERLWKMAATFAEFVSLACDRRHLEVLCPSCHAREERRA